MRKVAFLTMDELGDFVTYDHLLIEPLAALGWAVEMVPWRSRDTDWDRFDACIIRTPWDYQDDPEAFLETLERIERSRARLENDLGLVRWNMHKRYLEELAEQGAAIVPTRWGNDLTTEALAALHDRFGARLVIKPPISANADDTFVVDREDPGSEEAVLATFSGRDYMAQPFLARVCSEGEYSAFVFDGALSHAILKTPKPRDFRTQEEHGARIRAVEVSTELATATRRVMSCLDATPLYARVDLLRSDEGLLLMELELIEPSLYFEFDDDAPERFARAFHKRMAAPTPTV